MYILFSCIIFMQFLRFLYILTDTGQSTEEIPQSGEDIRRKERYAEKETSVEKVAPKNSTKYRVNFVHCALSNVLCSYQPSYCPGGHLYKAIS